MSLSKDQTTTIYWIRHKDHTDLMTQGYVGITTKTAEFRYRQHINFNLSKDIQSNFNRAVRLYYPKGELVLEELCITTKEHALYLENKLRPDFLIGWNICQGGQIGLPYLNDKQITLGRQRSKANLKVKKGKDHHCYGNYKLMNFLNVPIQKTKGLHKLFRKGRIPILDQKWLDFYEQNKKEGYESFEESTILG